MKRVAVAGFQHETNTFGATLAVYADFEIADAWPPLLRGADVLSGTRGINLPMAGFVSAAEAAGDIDIVPVSWCSAEPSSYVTDDAFDRISAMIIDGIRSAGGIDGVYLDLHGAMVTQSHEDGEGELLARLRAVLGDELPIVVSLDLHANVTETMVRHASAFTIFRTYPHIDMDATGARALPLLRHLMNGDPLFKAFRQAQFLVPLQAQYTGAEPCRALYGGLLEIADAGVTTVDIAMGFPPADIHDAGPSLVVYGTEPGAVEAAADQFLRAFDAAEPLFDVGMLSAADAVARAMAAERAGRPVVLADAQDNPGAGAPSDTTGLLAALVEAGAGQAVVGLLNDPEVAAAAHAAGVGATIDAVLGGKSGFSDQPPYEGRFVVEALGDGRFEFTGEMYKGAVAELGPVALLRVDTPDADVRVVVGSHRCQCLDQAIFRHVGVEPTEQAILGVKSTVHFRADFEPIAAEVIVVDTPGANPCMLSRIPYRNLRQGVRLL
ncbi:MAG: M81 family metallopeptidase [Rhodospirillales bacterium]